MAFTQQQVSILRPALITALVALLGITAFALGSLLGAPIILMWFLNALFAGGMVYYTGVSYGIFNDLSATKDSLVYFTNGHQYGQRNLVPTHDRVATSVAWGYGATWGLSVIAAVLFVIPVFIMSAVGLPFAAAAVALLCLVGLAIAAVAKGYSRYKMNQRKKAYAQGILKSHVIHGTGLDSTQKEVLERVIKTDDQANAWLGCSDRNGFGYIALPVAGLVGLIATIVLTALSVEPLLMGALGVANIAVPIFPIAIAGVVVLTVVGLTIYMLVNHNKPAPDAHAAPAPQATVTPAPDRRDPANKKAGPKKGPLTEPLLERQDDHGYSNLRDAHRQEEGDFIPDADPAFTL